jgi:very-short-patch-repair endonuclease
VAADEDEDRDGWLSDHGWTVVPLDAKRVLTALSREEGETR